MGSYVLAACVCVSVCVCACVNSFSSTKEPAESMASQLSQIVRDYVEQTKEMKDRTTLYVDFEHLTEYNQQLADVIMLQYYRYEGIYLVMTPLLL